MITPGASNVNLYHLPTASLQAKADDITLYRTHSPALVQRNTFYLTGEANFHLARGDVVPAFAYAAVYHHRQRGLALLSQNAHQQVVVHRLHDLSFRGVHERRII